PCRPVLTQHAACRSLYTASTGSSPHPLPEAVAAASPAGRTTRLAGAHRASAGGPGRQNREAFAQQFAPPAVNELTAGNQKKSRPAANSIPINFNSSIRRQFTSLIGEMKISPAKSPPHKAFSRYHPPLCSYKSGHFFTNSITLHKITQIK
ncbi:hypothetical protein, partial [Burkholderia sp.]|uniref:hypothetical protein n=1 Tax=Burkholderia sp. TaxID=36773 RepID=UPI00258EB0E4